MTDLAKLEAVIEAAWEARADLSPSTHGEVRRAVETAIDLLDSGQARVASRGADGVWSTHQWLKKAVLLSFRLNDNEIMRAGERRLSAPGTTRSPTSSPTGPPTSSRKPASALCPARSFARAPSSTGTSS
jgi:2,3,4,5-tetrahydropyridine-2-carboxylate N-succinyltransferase